MVLFCTEVVQAHSINSMGFVGPLAEGLDPGVAWVQLTKKCTRKVLVLAWNDMCPAEVSPP